MSIYGKIFARFYDRMMARTEAAGFRQMREEVLEEASGTVLEIGAGTGANVPLYGDSVEKLILAEPSPAMIKRLETSTSGSNIACDVMEATAESLPLDDSSVDTVVSTIVLCTVESPERTLAEIARVLKPNGKFLFLEHVRSSEPRLAAWQDRLNWFWKKIGHGCNCNRRTLNLIGDSQLSIVDSKRGKVPKAVPLVRPCITGTAVRVKSL